MATKTMIKSKTAFGAALAGLPGLMGLPGVAAQGAIAIGLGFGIAAPAHAAGPTTEEWVQQGSPIRHDRVKPIVWRCAQRERLASEMAKAKGMEPNDPRNLILVGVKDKPIVHSPAASLGWVDMTLRLYGNPVSLNALQGIGRNQVLQLATLVHNDYTIAAQMALGPAMSSSTWPHPQGLYVARMIASLTEYAEDVPDIDRTNRRIAEAVKTIASLRPEVRGYARWAIRGFAYDDDVAIDATMTGLCLAKVTQAEQRTIEAAIKASQFRP